jgi:hypothetical protein
MDVLAMSVRKWTAKVKMAIVLDGKDLFIALCNYIKLISIKY